MNKKETQIIISQTCPPKEVFKGINNPSEIRNSIKYIEPSNDYDNIWETINHTISSEYVNGSIRECIVFSDFMHSPDSSFIKNFES